MKYKLYTRKQMTWRYGFALIAIIAGILLNYLNLGAEFFAYGSVGNYLISIGFLILFLTTLFYISKKEKVIDERMEKIGYKASRVTFLFMVIGAFVIMLWDGIEKITIPYQISMSYFVCTLLIIYFIAYKWIERKI
jgi:uncharacterized membrane protein